ncbi:MAG: type II toxin-antitoxin system HicA family toxin [SAR324 cluster bacterium]|nr:type II toxin-antitoxin system HicA family toxin [SAR324 cluster bacterium]
MKTRELDRLLKRAGWFEVKARGKGSHRVYSHERWKHIVVVPWHGGRDIKPGLLKHILKSAGIE